MSGETEKDISGWTTDTSRQDILRTLGDLEKHMDRRFTDQDKAVQAALQAAKEAVLKAENANDKRFEAANEVKATFSGELGKKLDRTEYDSNHKSLQKQVDDLKRTVFIGVGIAITLSFGLPILIQFIR